MSLSAPLTNTQALLALNGLPRLGPVTLRRLLDEFNNDPNAILNASTSALRRVERIGEDTADIIRNWEKHFNLAREEERLAKAGASFVAVTDSDYPKPLKKIYDPPLGLYMIGPLRPAIKTVAIVGSRRTTLYGRSIAKRLAQDLVRIGFCVVSGLARGIDTDAHQGVVDVGGDTAAVLGCGVDIVYPPENIELYKAIAERGVLISELPFGTRASKTTFPMRNRLIAGMAAATIVVESDTSGGSMITARFTMEQNRPLFAVPGRIDQPSSAGCHQLIRDGAILLTSIDDLISELAYGGTQQQELMLEDDSGVSMTMSDEQRDNQLKDLNEDERTVFTPLVDGDALTRDALIARTGLPAHAVSATLLMLELKRRVGKRADGAYERRM
ncbi:DNA-processing protein DprA [Cerasicoccus arenae]|uniref:DNA polymerase n=1 Tax=Cerasicoccus arenae TaxID=424488 RepID=A0A8J3D9Z2_9BACT|nr:DNA-processing protein DprA [Cerasicoccus arenae]MBK1857244.1 DNA-protecting protein DprA [Cerasicoccus arenae]GHC00236.1 DNA polymerase [Cerasicoccus arenae]